MPYILLHFVVSIYFTDTMNQSEPVRVLMTNVRTKGSDIKIISFSVLNITLGDYTDRN
jgi:hypothetical protein